MLEMGEKKIPEQINRLMLYTRQKKKKTRYSRWSLFLRLEKKKKKIEKE